MGKARQSVSGSARQEYGIIFLAYVSNLLIIDYCSKNIVFIPSFLEVFIVTFQVFLHFLT